VGIAAAAGLGIGASEWDWLRDLEKCINCRTIFIRSGDVPVGGVRTSGLYGSRGGL